MKTLLTTILIAVFANCATAAVNYYRLTQNDGENGNILPYITLYSTYTQNIVATDAAQYIELNSSVNGVGQLTQINKSTWAVVDAGVYEFCFSGIGNLTAPPAGNLEMWFRINNVDVADSNSIIGVPNTTTDMTMAMCWANQLNAGDTFNAMTYGSDTDLQWLYVAAGTNPTRPATPSIIMTVKKTSGLH